MHSLLEDGPAQRDTLPLLRDFASPGGARAMAVRGVRRNKRDGVRLLFEMRCDKG